MARTREDMLAELKANPKVQAHRHRRRHQRHQHVPRAGAAGRAGAARRRGDFCGACSSALSRMIHGGLRYLENGEFDLVRESLRERDGLLRNAPHFVAPLPTTVPIRHVFSGPPQRRLRRSSAVDRAGRARARSPIRAGLSSTTSSPASAAPCRSIASAAARDAAGIWPTCRRRLRFSATYYDAWVSHPERLGIEMMLDGLGARPACAGAQLCRRHARATAGASSSTTR